MGVAFLRNHEALTWTQGDMLYFWDLLLGKQVGRFKVPESLEGIACVAISPNGALIAVGGVNEILLWDALAKEQIKDFKIGPPPTGSDYLLVTAMAFSPDGKSIVVGDNNGHLRLLDSANGRTRREFQNHYAGITGLAFSPDGKSVLSGTGYQGLKSSDFTAHLWEAATGKELYNFGESPEQVKVVAFSPDGRFLVTGSDKLRVWDRTTRKEVRQIGPKYLTPRALAFSPDGLSILTGGTGSTAYLIDFKTGKEIKQLRGFGSAVWDVAFSGGAPHIAVAPPASVLVWDVLKRRVQDLFSASGPVAFSPDGKSLVTGGTVFSLWDVQSGEKVRDLGSSAYNGMVSFSQDGALLATGSFNHAEVWDIPVGSLVRALDLQGVGSVDALSLSPSGDLVALGIDHASFQSKENGSSCLWSVKTGMRTRCIGDDRWIHAIAFSPEGDAIVAAPSEEPPRKWNLKTGKDVAHFGEPRSTVKALAISSDARFVLTGDEDGTAQLFDASTGKLLHPLEGHLDAVKSAAFSPDSQFALTGSNDGTVRLWNTNTGTELCTMVTFENGSWVVVDSEGRFDTVDPGDIEGLYWIMPAAPLRPVPLDTFMQDYFEPGLLASILASKPLRPVTAITKLNHTPPRVKIASVAQEPSAPDRVTVNVEVEEPTDHSAVYDVRLFRDNHLVGYRDGNIPLSNGHASISFRHIKLSRSSREVKFSSYALNNSRVKSLTDQTVFKLPVPLRALLPKEESRFYLITIGVARPNDDLLYPARDARRIQETLAANFKAAYYDLVQIPLILGRRGETKLRDIPEVDPTKDNLKTILGMLANRKVEPEKLSKIPPQIRNKIRPADPDDLVLISFSGHADADEQGVLYLYPYDDRYATADMPKTSLISTEELSVWLRDVDSDEMVLIIDACHAAAAAGKGFRPGPFGQRGLGQLAYDKGMQVLVATQADNEAKENVALRQGLLTYALLEGLEGSTADVKGEGKVTIGAWLRYAERRVPLLYVENTKEDPTRLQEPYLFDFARSKGEFALFYSEQ
jgi:WD40 repeat protein